MFDVIRRQKEEIEKLKNQDRNTEKVNMALYKGIAWRKLDFGTVRIFFFHLWLKTHLKEFWCIEITTYRYNAIADLFSQISQRGIFTLNTASYRWVLGVVPT